jgi:hypothetical protein
MNGLRRCVGVRRGGEGRARSMVSVTDFRVSKFTSSDFRRLSIDSSTLDLAVRRCRRGDTILSVVSNCSSRWSAKR